VAVAGFAEEIERFLESFSPEEVAVMQRAFRAILDGRPVTVGELPAVVSLPPGVVEAAVGRLTERGLIAVKPETGQIVGARGLSLTETSHRLFLGGQLRYAFCAVDAVGIPAALGTAATIESRCHHCQTPLRLTVKDGVVIEAPQGMVIWAAERDLTRSLRAHT
jgi:hypothetical protein